MCTLLVATTSPRRPSSSWMEKFRRWLTLPMESFLRLPRAGTSWYMRLPATRFVSLSVCLSGHLSSVCVSAYLSVFCPCVCPFVCLSTCLPAHPSACCCYIWWWWWCSVASFPGLPTVQFLIVYCRLVLRPRPAFRHLQYGKVMESWAGPGNKAMFTVCKSNGKPFYHVNNVNVYLGRQRERGVPDCKNELETFSCGFHQSRKLTAPCSGQRMKREMCSFDSGSLSPSV